MIKMQNHGRAIQIHICKDRTLSYRQRSEPIFNGVAIAVFSVDTEGEAQELFELVGTRQYTAHPGMPGRPWFKLYNGVAGHRPTLLLEDLDEVERYLEARYGLVRVVSVNMVDDEQRTATTI